METEGFQQAIKTATVTYPNLVTEMDAVQRQRFGLALVEVLGERTTKGSSVSPRGRKETFDG